MGIPKFKFFDFNKDGLTDIVLMPKDERDVPIVFYYDGKKILMGSYNAPSPFSRASSGLEKMILLPEEIPQNCIMLGERGDVLGLYRLSQNPDPGHYKARQVKESVLALYYGMDLINILVVQAASDKDAQQILEEEKRNSTVIFGKGRLLASLSCREKNLCDEKKTRYWKGGFIQRKDFRDLSNYSPCDPIFLDFLEKYRRKTGLPEIWRSGALEELRGMAEVAKTLGIEKSRAHIRKVDFGDKQDRAVACWEDDYGNIRASFLKRIEGQYKLVKELKRDGGAWFEDAGVIFAFEGNKVGVDFVTRSGYGNKSEEVPAW
jgi:hypothetical protein